MSTRAAADRKTTPQTTTRKTTPREATPREATPREATPRETAFEETAQGKTIQGQSAGDQTTEGPGSQGEPQRQGQVQRHSEAERQVVSFAVGGEEFGVDILEVQEIIRPPQITEVPHAPDFVEGIINLRGRVLPVVDLRVRLGFPGRPVDESTRIIVVETEGKPVGLVTDAVREVQPIAAGRIEPAPDLTRGVESALVGGVARREEKPLLILLDLEEVLSHSEVEALRQMSEGEAGGLGETNGRERTEDER